MDSYVVGIFLNNIFVKVSKMSILLHHLHLFCIKIIVQCPIGTYGRNCLPCPRGYYQPLPGKSECLNCPQNQITRQKGSSHVQNCLKISMSYDVCHYLSNDLLSIASATFVYQLLFK